MGFNDITRARLVTKPPTEAYAEGLAKIEFVDDWVTPKGSKCPVEHGVRVAVECFNGKIKYGASQDFSWLTVKKFKVI
jgi:hypothetical protein